MTFSLGVDTGGTFTDAVLVDGQQVLACAKALTSHGALLDGLSEAVAGVLKEIDPCDVGLVSLSTTLATNAVVEGQGRSVGLVLIGFSEHWLARARLGEALGSDPVVFIRGGHTAAGVEAEALDLDALAREAATLVDRVEAWAVSAVFAVRNPQHEKAAAECLAALSGKPVSVGYRLSASLDAPRRALTALLNARLIPSLVELLDATSHMLQARGIDAPLMVVKGDGTLISASLARELPVETVLSGPAASVVAAGVLGAAGSGVVVDIGGTTSDIAVLENGLPRLDPDGAQIGGWRTMVQAVDVASIGLGGDSELSLSEAGEIRAGPRRAIPLCLLAINNDEVIATLLAQLERPWPASHDAVFVVALPVGDRQPQGAGRRQLLARIAPTGTALEHLFEGRTEALTLARLEAEGFVRRACFTPSDACHVLGLQQSWSQQAAVLGARLWARQIEDAGATLLSRYSSQAPSSVEHAVARAACAAVELATATLVSQHVLLLSADGSRRNLERGRWVEELLRERQQREEAMQCSDAALETETTDIAATRVADIELSPRLQVPLLGLGASADRYHPGAARLLGTTCEVPDSAGVANAIGAVSGVVQQQCRVMLQPGGGLAVIALLPEGPMRHDDLEAAARCAEERVQDMVKAAALAAGMDTGDTTLVITCQRRDTVVEQDGGSVFVESEISATASGRPARFRP